MLAALLSVSLVGVLASCGKAGTAVPPIKEVPISLGEAAETAQEFLQSRIDEYGYHDMTAYVGGDLQNLEIGNPLTVRYDNRDKDLRTVYELAWPVYSDENVAFFMHYSGSQGYYISSSAAADVDESAMAVLNNTADASTGYAMVDSMTGAPAELVSLDDVGGMPSGWNDVEAQEGDRVPVSLMIMAPRYATEVTDGPWNMVYGDFSGVSTGSAETCTSVELRDAVLWAMEALPDKYECRVEAEDTENLPLVRDAEIFFERTVQPLPGVPLGSTTVTLQEDGSWVYAVELSAKDSDSLFASMGLGDGEAEGYTLAIGYVVGPDGVLREVRWDVNDVAGGGVAASGALVYVAL